MMKSGDAANKLRRRDYAALVRWLFAGVMVVAGLALIVFYALSPVSQPASFNGLSFPEPEPAPDFALTDQNHQPFRLSDHQGKLLLLYFGFTHCPDECPATLSIWKQVAKRLEADAQQVRFVMVTVDPERDTPEVMGQYLSIFNPAFIGLSGPVGTLEDIAIDYNVYFKRLRLTEEEVMSSHVSMDDDGHDSETGHSHEETYLVAHTTLTYLIDETGKLILAYPLETPSTDIVSDLEQLLN